MATAPTKMQTFSFQWNIRNFDDYDLDGDAFFDSPQFSVVDRTFTSIWRLRIYPDEYYARVVGRFALRLQLLRMDEGSIFYTKHSISLLRRNGDRFQTEYFTQLGVPLQYDDLHQHQHFAVNCVPLQTNVRKFLDAGVLSVLFEIEIYDKDSGLEVAVPEKHTQQQLATTLLIQQMPKPTAIELKHGEHTYVCLPHGQHVVWIEGTLRHVTQTTYCMHFKIHDEAHEDITEVPITIYHDRLKSTWSITRNYSGTLVLICNAFAFVAIATRCTVVTPENAAAIGLTPCMRTLRADYRDFFVQSDFGDVSIVVNGQTMRAHKDILSKRSQIFAAMFTHEWLEKNAQTITIGGFEYSTIRAMIEYIYYGSGDDELGTADPVELLKAAHMYQLDDLMNKCELRLCKSLKTENVRRFGDLADIYDLMTLENATNEFMNTNEIVY